MLDSENFKSHWSILKDEIINHWPKLPQTEVENTEGNLQMLNRLLVKTYGEDANRDHELEELYHRIELRRKNSRPTYAGSRDNSPERKLNANYSQVNSPEEVKTGQTNTPTIFEEEDLH